MVQLISQPLAELRLGEPSACRHLTMFPLLGGRAGDPDYLTLDEALAAGAARVTEVDESGSVPELHFQNSGAWAVLLLDGEELVGAKQNRVLNLTILAPAGKSLGIPVSCVEAGRWSSVSATFAAAPRAQYAAGRARKMASVSRSLETQGARLSDQGEVWADISAKAERLCAPSATDAMAAIYAAHAGDVEAYVQGLKAVDGQCGAIFALGSRIVGLDLFDYQATLTKLLPKLVRSYALDALDTSAAGGASAETAPATPEAAAAWLALVAQAAGQRFPAVGEGEDVRLAAAGLTGAGLLARDRLVHLSAFSLAPRKGSGASPTPTRISRPSARRRH